MKDSSKSPLGYLASFTLGIICMGAIFFFTRSPAPGDAIQGNESGVEATPGSARIHFQRTNSTAGLRESLQLPRANARPLAPVAKRPAAEFAVLTEAAEESQPEEPAPAETETVIIPPRVVAPGVAAAPIENAQGARISGRVFLMFKPPAEKPLPLDARCGAEFRARGMAPTTQHFVVGRDNGLGNVLVMVTAGLPQRRWPVPQQAVSLRLRGCIYENPIAALQTGQRLLVENFDKVLHNVHSQPERSRESNFAMMPRARPLPFVFEEPELFVRFKCDVHPWEFAYVSVLEHPFFAVTDANGNFAISGLPAGRYTVEAHHRKAGVLRREVTVEEFRNGSADFHFRQPAGQPENI
jgi:hypothetical protein